MAQKALKTLAARNTATLNKTHQIALAVHLFFLISRLVLFSSRSRRLTPYIVLSFPSLVLEFWLERVGRPQYVSPAAATASSGTAELKRAGEDLDAKGLTEWMWDVIYWTWLNIGLVALVGDRAWWLFAVVPAYSGYLAFTTYSGIRQGLGGGIGGGEGGEKSAAGHSKRQAKIEKRGGQKVQYR